MSRTNNKDKRNRKERQKRREEKQYDSDLFWEEAAYAEAIEQQNKDLFEANW